MNRVIADTGARYPVVQAPMGRIARSRFDATVRAATVRTFYAQT